MLERVIFDTHEESARVGGFVALQWEQACSFSATLGCETDATGGTMIDTFGRTTVKGVYAAGETIGFPSNLIVAASQGNMAAVGVNMDLIESAFL